MAERLAWLGSLVAIGVSHSESTGKAGQMQEGMWISNVYGVMNLGRPRIDIIEVEGESRMNALLTRISVDPNVCFGKPCIRGTRIWVSLLLDFLASGSTIEEILAEYPHLQRDDVLAAIAYGAEMSRERFVDVPGSTVA